MAKSEHDLALKAMEAEVIKVEQNRAGIRLDEVESSTIEAERRIKNL